ncbi:MAG: TonB-dependent receptor [Steroidobacteraceae bacterium]
MLLGPVGALVISSDAAAQSPNETGSYNFNISVEPLEDALNELAQQSGLQVLFSSRLVDRLSSPAVKGQLTAEEALRALLADTGLRFEFVNSHTITINLDQNRENTMQNRNAVRHQNLFARIFGLFAVCSSTLHAGSACAQDAAASASGKKAGVQLEEIVVTARRSEESLQQTPVSVVAVSGDQLASMGVDSLKNFDVFVPNLSIGGTQGNGTAVANFSIRGIGGGSSGWVTQEGAVGVYVDDILLAHPNGAFLDIVDAEQLEVLRGPQGTLFGRNTAGGAVRYTSKKPTAELGGNFNTTLGSYNRRDVSGTLNLPLTNTLAFRGTFANKTRDGYISRVIDGNSTGDENVTAARSQLRWQPSDKLDINLSANKIKTFDHGTPTVIGAYRDVDALINMLYTSPSVTAAAVRALTPASVTTFGGAGIAGTPAAAAAAASDIAAYNAANGKYTTYGGTPERNGFTSSGVGLTVQYELADNLTFKSLSGYNHGHQRLQQDYDRAPIVLVAQEDIIDMKTFTQEFQLNGRAFDDRLKWVGGLFYYNDQSRNDKWRTVPTDIVRALEYKDIDTKSIAVYGQGTFDFTDRFSATAGLRWNRDTKDFTVFRFGRNSDPATNSLPAEQRTYLPISTSGNWASFSPRLGLEQRWTQDFMTYVSVAKGFKAGGFNDNLVSASGTTNCSDASCGITDYKPENLVTYEAGLRSEFLDHRVRLNLTGFYTDYKDMQVSAIKFFGTQPAQITLNAGATVSGVELDTVVAVSDHLTVRGAFGYTKSEYASDIAVQTSGVLGRTSPLLRSPKISYTVGTTYKQPLINDAELVFDLNWGWKDSQSSTASPTNTVILPSYGLLNGRLEYQASNNWGVALFGNNLLNEYYLTSAFDPSGPASKDSHGSSSPHDSFFGMSLLDVGRPREVGVELSYKF